MKSILKLGLTLTMTTTMLYGCTASDMQNMVSGGEAISTTAVKYKPTSPNRVKLYYSNIGKPKHYRVIGRVSANNDNMMGIPHSQKTISNELQVRAAELGANGVINISVDFEKTSGDAILSK